MWCACSTRKIDFHSLSPHHTVDVIILNSLQSANATFLIITIEINFTNTGDDYADIQWLPDFWLHQRLIPYSNIFSFFFFLYHNIYFLIDVMWKREEAPFFIYIYINFFLFFSSTQNINLTFLHVLFHNLLTFSNKNKTFQLFYFNSNDLRLWVNEIYFSREFQGFYLKTSVWS